MEQDSQRQKTDSAFKPLKIVIDRGRKLKESSSTF